jgi:hypothetical protein
VHAGFLRVNDERCTRESKFRIANLKTAFSREKSLFTIKLGLNLRKKLAKCYIWNIFYGAETWTVECRSEIPGKIWNLLEKFGKGQLD